MLTLTSISSDAARSAHVMTEHDGAMTELALSIPAHGSSVLKPDAAHLMLESPRALTEGETVHLTLTFDDGTTVPVDAPVIGLLDPAPTG